MCKRATASLLVALILLAASDAAERPATSHQAYRADAMAAYARKDYAAARDAFAAALKLRPDSPRYVYNLAALSALLGDEAGALRYLQQLAKLGAYLPAQKDSDFASLQGKPAFAAVLRALADNRAPRGQAEVL